MRGARQERGRRGLHSGAAKQRAGVSVQAQRLPATGREVSRRGGRAGGGVPGGAPSSCLRRGRVCVSARPALRLTRVPSVGRHSYPDDAAQVRAECTVRSLVCPGPQARDARGRLGFRSRVCF